MESLKISTGVKSLQILDDDRNERGIFRFNPEDIESAKAILELQKDLAEKETLFTEKAKTCESADEQVEFLDELVTYFETAIDRCFGTGSSAILFGGAKTLSMFEDFFNGITPYYKEASEKRMAKYKKRSGK